MGFSDIATYFKTDDVSLIEATITPLLKELGFESDLNGGTDEFIASYDEPQALSKLAVWAKKAAPNWWRLYSNAPGLFTWHSGDDTPFLQLLAKNGATKAFEIYVEDGDSICVFETEGAGYRLTGANACVLDDLYELGEGLDFAPGSIFQFKGVRLAYDALEVDAQIIEELKDYDFGFDMQEAIVAFEISRFGKALNCYYEFSEADVDAKWSFQQK